jgi:hypothetical protein
MFGTTLQDIRKSMGWVFGVSALMTIWKFFSMIRWMNDFGYDFVQLRSLFLAYFPALAMVNTMAWWSIWKDKRWARGWGIAASLICIELPIRRMIRFHHSPWGDLGGLVVIGVACLIAFLWPSPMKPANSDPKPEGNPS